MWIAYPTFNCPYCEYTTTDKINFEYHLDYRIHPDRPGQAHLTYRCQRSPTAQTTYLLDLPNEVLHLITRLTPEGARRVMKNTCKKLHNVYRAFVADEKMRIARRLIKFEPCTRYVRTSGLHWTPCNGMLKKPVGELVTSNRMNIHTYQWVHECVCSYMPIKKFSDFFPHIRS